MCSYLPYGLRAFRPVCISGSLCLRSVFPPFRGSSGNKLHCADGIVARGKNESVYFIVASFKSKGRRFGVLENLFLSVFRVCIEIVLFIEVPWMVLNFVRRNWNKNYQHLVTYKGFTNFKKVNFSINNNNFKWNHCKN